MEGEAEILIRALNLAMRQLVCAAPRCLEGGSSHVFQWHLTPDKRASRACVSGDICPLPLVTPHLKIQHNPRGKKSVACKL